MYNDDLSVLTLVGQPVLFLIHEMVIDFSFNLPNPSSHTMTLGKTQPVEMSTRNLFGR
jgi:hypothetical protein